jgi:hypothetical protein
VPRLMATITGCPRCRRHPKHPPGKQIETREVVWIDRQWSWARTASRVYELGDPAGREIPIGGIDV